MGGLSEIGGLSDRLVMMTQMALMEWEDGVCGMYRLDITCTIVSECRPVLWTGLYNIGSVGV